MTSYPWMMTRTMSFKLAKGKKIIKKINNKFFSHAPNYPPFLQIEKCTQKSSNCIAHKYIDT